MKKMTIHIEKFTRRAPMAGVLTIKFIIGGSKSALIRLKHSIGNSVVVAIDNPREIQLRRAEFGDNGVFYFAMGDGETSRSAHLSSDEATRDASNRTTSMSMFPGFGARLSNAAKAAQLLIRSEEFQLFLSQLPEHILWKTGGNPSTLQIEFYGSNAGAAYSGTASMFSDATVKALSYFGTQIQVYFDILGPITFAQVAPRARLNSGSSLLSTINYALDFSKPFEIKTCKRIFLHEVFPYGNDQDTRNAFLSLDAVMMDSVQMQDFLMQPRPNEEQDDCFGAIMSRNVDFMTPLDRRADIASVVADGFLSDLGDAKQALLPDLSTVSKVSFDIVSTKDNQRESPERIESLIFTHPPEDLLKSIGRPDKWFRYQMRFESSAADCIPEHASRTMAKHPTSLFEFMRRLEVLIGYRQIAENELAAIDQELEEVNTTIASLESRFVRTVSKARKRRVQMVPQGTVSYVTELRKRYDLAHDLRMQREAAERGLTAICTEVDFLESTFTSIELELKRWLPKTGLTNESPAVTRRNIDVVFDQLMRIEQLSDSQKLDLFCDAAGQVTRDGLAKIVGSDSSRVEAIADRIVSGPYVTIAPSHGAQRFQTGQAAVYSIPPCDPPTEELLVEAIGKLSPSAKVVFGDTIAFGACVQRVRFRRFHKLQSLFDGLTGHDLWLAFTDPLSNLNTSDKWEALKRLGGRVVGERIVFDEDIVDPTLPPTHV